MDELFKLYVTTTKEYKEWCYPMNHFSSFAIKNNYLGIAFNNTDNVWGEFRSLDLSDAEIETDNEIKSKQERKIIMYLFNNFNIIEQMKSLYKTK